MDILIPQWLGITGFGILELSGLVMIMWPANLRSHTSFSQKFFSSLRVGFGVFLSTISFAPLVSFLFMKGEDAPLSVGNVLSMSVCVGALAFLFGISAAVGNFVRYGMLNLFDKRLLQIVEKSKQREQK